MIMHTQTVTTWSQNHWMCAMHHSSKQSNKIGFHEEHFSCGWSSENPLQGGGKCNRWNMDLWKSTGKVSMSKMLWWKFSRFAVTCSTLSLFLLIPPILRFVIVIPPISQHPFTFLSAKDILWHNYKIIQTISFWYWNSIESKESRGVDGRGLGWRLLGSIPTILGSWMVIPTKSQQMKCWEV